MFDKRYQITKPFEFNKENGPFEEIDNKNSQIKEILGENGIDADFFGFKTKLPIGVAAGPLYNKNYMKGAANDGFEVICWKTFRSVARLAHRSNGDFLGHNIVFIKSDMFDKSKTDNVLKGSLEFNEDKEKVSITNSFGMPSTLPSVWMPEIVDIEKFTEENNKQTIASVVGTPDENGGISELADDYAFCARMCELSGAKIIEVNLSCPNVKGKEGSIFKNPKDAALIVKRTKEFFINKNTKLLMKVGYCEVEEYEELLKETSPYIDGVVAINTIPMAVVDKEGMQALPGGSKSGICGYPILDMAVQAVKNLVQVKEKLNLDLRIFGCGGVTSPEAFMKHIDAGAEFVFVGTAALFNPELPTQIAKYLAKNNIKRSIIK